MDFGDVYGKGCHAGGGMGKRLVGGAYSVLMCWSDGDGGGDGSGRRESGGEWTGGWVGARGQILQGCRCDCVRDGQGKGA